MLNINIFMDNLLKLKNQKGEFKGSITDPNHVYLDFDDIVPFFLYLGYNKEIEQQIELSKKYLYNGFIPLGDYIYSWRMDEYLGGILSYNNKNEDILKSQKIFLNKILNLGYIPAYINIKDNKISKLSFSRGYNIIEVILESNYFDDEIKQKSLTILRNFIDNNKFFQKNHLFLSKYKFNKTNESESFVGTDIKIMNNRMNMIKDSSSYLNSKVKIKNKILKIMQHNFNISRVQLMKDNSNLIYSIIEAYKFTEDVYFKKILNDWIFKGVIDKMYNKKGFVYTNYEGGKCNGICLAQNFTFLDILLDYYYFIEKDSVILNYAKDIANFWLSQRMKNGLISEQLGSDIDFLDCQTDFSISLKKLSELDNNNYKKEGIKLYQSILRHHYNKESGLLMIKIDKNNKVIDKTISLKYNALFLKAYIIYGTGNDKDIYSNEIMIGLMKDR